MTGVVASWRHALIWFEKRAYSAFIFVPLQQAKASTPRRCNRVAPRSPQTWNYALARARAPPALAQLSSTRPRLSRGQMLRADLVSNGSLQAPTCALHESPRRRPRPANYSCELMPSTGRKSRAQRSRTSNHEARALALAVHVSSSAADDCAPLPDEAAAAPMCKVFDKTLCKMKNKGPPSFDGCVKRRR